VKTGSGRLANPLQARFPLRIKVADYRPVVKTLQCVFSPMECMVIIQPAFRR